MPRNERDNPSLMTQVFVKASDWWRLIRAKNTPKASIRAREEREGDSTPEVLIDPEEMYARKLDFAAATQSILDRPIQHKSRGNVIQWTVGIFVAIIASLIIYFTIFSKSSDDSTVHFSSNVEAEGARNKAFALEMLDLNKKLLQQMESDKRIQKEQQTRDEEKEKLRQKELEEYRKMNARAISADEVKAIIEQQVAVKLAEAGSLVAKNQQPQFPGDQTQQGVDLNAPISPNNPFRGSTTVTTTNTPPANSREHGKPAQVAETNITQNYTLPPPPVAAPAPVMRRMSIVSSTPRVAANTAAPRKIQAPRALKSWKELASLKPGQKFTMSPGSVDAFTLSGADVMTGEGAMGTVFAAASAGGLNFGGSMGGSSGSGDGDISASRAMAQRPITIAIKGKVLGANNYSFDLKNCEASFAGAAERSTERVHLMGRKLICNFPNGLRAVADLNDLGVVVTDPSGKEGVLGKMVSKEGHMLSLAFLSEFVKSVGSVYQGTNFATPVYGQTPTVNGQVISQAGGMALSSSASRFTEYMLSLAQDSRPYIEIQGGIPVAVKFTEEIEFEVKSSISGGDTSTAGTAVTTTVIGKPQAPSTQLFQKQQPAITQPQEAQLVTSPAPPPVAGVVDLNAPVGGNTPPAAGDNRRTAFINAARAEVRQMQ